MSLSQNQFLQTPVQGQIDLDSVGKSNTIAVQVDSTQVTALVAGQAFKVVDSAGGIPKVISLVSDSDAPNGFVELDNKDSSYPAGARLEAAIDGTAMYMTAAGAISRWGKVQVVGASNKVKAWDGVSPAFGLAFDKAAADGDLIRVLIQDTNANSGAGLKQAVVTATLAQINAGLVLIPGVAGKKINVTDYVARVVGAFATGTSVELESDATAVAITTIAEAGLTNGAVLTPASSNTTLGAGFAAQLPTGEGVKVVNNGTAQTAGTSITYTITYNIQ